jgi:hypothetical protein
VRNRNLRVALVSGLLGLDILVLGGSGIGVASSVASDTIPQPPTVTRTVNVSGSMPDLIVQSMEFASVNGGACDYSASSLALYLVVANVGNADALSFIVTVSDRPTIEVPGLTAGTVTTLTYSNSESQQVTATVDAEHMVAESDEGNNVLAQFVPVPTPPPPCTATPTPTGTQGSISLPTPTRSATPSASATLFVDPGVTPTPMLGVFLPFVPNGTANSSSAQAEGSILVGW